MQWLDLFLKVCCRVQAVQLCRSQQPAHSLQGLCGHALPREGHLENTVRTQVTN